MCGATDCPSCGPAQGYRLDGEDAEHGDDRDEDAEKGLATLELEGFALDVDTFDFDDDGPDDHAAGLAADRYERDMDARASQ